jgi:hypothetical protein
VSINASIGAAACREIVASVGIEQDRHERVLPLELQVFEDGKKIARPHVAGRFSGTVTMSLLLGRIDAAAAQHHKPPHRPDSYEIARRFKLNDAHVRRLLRFGGKARIGHARFGAWLRWSSASR